MMTLDRFSAQEFLIEFRSHIPVIGIVIHFIFVGGFFNDCTTASEIGFAFVMLCISLLIIASDILLGLPNKPNIPRNNKYLVFHAITSLLNYFAFAYARAKPFKCFHDEYSYTTSVSLLIAAQVLNVFAVYMRRKVFRIVED